MRLVLFAPVPRSAGGSPAVRLRHLAVVMMRFLRNAAVSRPGRWIIGLALVGMTIVVLTALFGPQVIAITMFSPVSSSIIVLVSLAGVAIVSWYRDRAHALKSLMIREGMCPACGYSLRDSEPEADGRTTCAECGAAWRLDDPAYAATDTGSEPRVVVVRTALPEQPPVDHHRSHRVGPELETQ